MINNLREDKFKIIFEAFILGRYDTVIQESCKIFESIMRRLLVEANAKINYSDRKKIMQIEEKIGKGNKGIENFTFGEIIRLFRECDFIKMWALETQKDFSVLDGINFDTINKLRNLSAHVNEEKVITREEAEYVFSSLKLFLATLGYTGFEKYVENVFDIMPQKTNDSPNDKSNIKKWGHRLKNIYEVANTTDEKRVKIGNQINGSNDIAIINKLLSQMDELKILDVGCYNGKTIHTIFGENHKVAKVIGIDINEQIIEQANIQFGDNKFSFHNIDCESENFVNDMLKVMKDNNIEQFDLLYIAHTLLHLKSPYKLLKGLRTLLKNGGSIYIREPEDGMEFAYPDPSGIVERILEIVDYCEMAGYRRSGREIYTLLKRAGYSNIEVNYQMINTTNKSYDEREDLFLYNYSYEDEGLYQMMQKYPSVTKYKEDYDWLKKAYEELEELFHSEEFFYQFGLMIFSAQK